MQDPQFEGLPENILATLFDMVRAQQVAQSSGDGLSIFRHIGLTEIEQIIFGISLRARSLIDFIGGAPAVRSDLYRRERWNGDEVHQALARGCTVRINDIHLFTAPIWSFCKRLEAHFTAAVSANLYLTAPSERGLDWHADDHDVLILQMSGMKSWEIGQIRSPILPKPPLFSFEGRKPRDPKPSLNCETSSQKTERWELRPGDILYVPAGTPHRTRTLEELSASISIGLYFPTWADLLLGIVRANYDTIPALADRFICGGQTDGDIGQRTMRSLLGQLAESASYEKSEKVVLEIFSKSRNSFTRFE